jgi:ribosome-associated translation inhibitor RaiA
MPVPVEITFLGMTRSPTVERTIHRWVARLEKSFERMQKCAAWIELPHRHSHKGSTFHVRVEISVPGDTLVINRDSGLDHAHEDVYVAIGDAFRAARRRLQSRVEIERGEVKLHA